MRIDPRMMDKMMKQMGIKTEVVSPKKVIFVFENEQWVIEKPEVTQMTVQGNKIFQIVGSVEVVQDIKKEDIELVMQQANVDESKAKEALENTNGDIAEAILLLTQ